MQADLTPLMRDCLLTATPFRGGMRVSRGRSSTVAALARRGLVDGTTLTAEGVSVRRDLEAEERTARGRVEVPAWALEDVLHWWEGAGMGPRESTVLLAHALAEWAKRGGAGGAP